MKTNKTKKNTLSKGERTVYREVAEIRRRQELTFQQTQLEMKQKQASNFYDTVNPDILPPTAKKVLENKQWFGNDFSTWGV